jgi:hypothetical protein
MMIGIGISVSAIRPVGVGEEPPPEPFEDIDYTETTPVLVVAQPIKGFNPVSVAFPDGVQNAANYRAKNVGATIVSVIRQYRINGGPWRDG